MSTNYKNSGVDIHAGYEAVSRIKGHIKKTHRPGVMSEPGGFGGLFDLGSLGYKEPVLVSGTDGVGTKLMLAFRQHKHDTIGIDAVAMCVNDVVTQGAAPLFFLDYIACGKLEPVQIEAIVAGVADGCVQAGCALIGGETAEMPGMYLPGEYDIAGFCVAAAEKQRIITGQKIRPGNILVGLPSSGVHSNGFSLVRKIIADNNLLLDSRYSGLDKTLGETLLTPTRIYVKAVLGLMEKHELLGVAHITGGGFIENIPRIFPLEPHLSGPADELTQTGLTQTGLLAQITRGSWKMPGIFPFLQGYSKISDEEMYNVFNMGIGMVIAVESAEASAVLATLETLDEEAYIIGKVISADDTSVVDIGVVDTAEDINVGEVVFV